MITGLSVLFESILLSSLLALVLSPAMVWLAGKLKLVDKPGSAEHKLHQSATPMAGGLVLLAAGSISIAILPVRYSVELLGILGAAFIVAIAGLIDDCSSLKPLYKLIGQIIAASVVVYFGVQVHITQVGWIDLSLSFLWLIGMTNAFNFVDSMDGLAAGLAGIASAFFMLVTIDSSQPALSGLCAVILGIMIGSFLFTSPPAKMFLGDSGSQMLGILLASIGIAYTPGQAGLPQGLTWFIPILVLGVPIFDMALVVISRLRRGEPIYRAGRDHLYHRITMLGAHSNRAVLMMQITAIILGLLAFLSLGTNVVLANLIFGCVVVTGILILVLLELRYGEGLEKSNG
jgi:UDP-GlcNAc:undecaprenyl-phosphate GlcNAc-1-phosphate transferase